MRFNDLIQIIFLVICVLLTLGAIAFFVYYTITVLGADLPWYIKIHLLLGGRS